MYVEDEFSSKTLGVIPTHHILKNKLENNNN